jgi:hypothetical protein
MRAEITDLRGPVAPLDPALLAEREAAAQVPRLYCLGIDTHDEAMVLSLFDPDAPVSGMLGVANAADYLPKLVAGAGQFAVTMHSITNQYVVLEGARAKVWSYCVCRHVYHDAGRPPYVTAVVYKDELKRTPEGWIIAARAADHQWREGEGPGQGWR